MKRYEMKSKEEIADMFIKRAEAHNCIENDCVCYVDGACKGNQSSCYTSIATRLVEEIPDRPYREIDTIKAMEDMFDALYKCKTDNELDKVSPEYFIRWLYEIKQEEE